MLRRMPFGLGRSTHYASPVRLFEEFFTELDRNLGTGFSSDFAVDVQNHPDSVVIKADMPGVSKEDLKVILEGGVLTIGGERRKEAEEKRENFYIREREMGTFSRSFRLPSDIDENSVSAVLDNGVLQLTIKRSEKTKARTVKIS